MAGGQQPMIAHTIQLALAPVFMLVAIGNIMNILTTRLGRIVDRSRALQRLYTETEGAEHDAVVVEMRYIDRRIQLIGRALLTLVLSGLSVGVTVAVLFIAELRGLPLDAFIGISFFVAIALLMIALVFLMLETRLVAMTLRLPSQFLELHRPDL